MLASVKEKISTAGLPSHLNSDASRQFKWARGDLGFCGKCWTVVLTSKSSNGTGHPIGPITYPVSYVLFT